MVVLPEAADGETAAAAERIRRAVEDLAVDHPALEGGVVTVSVGAATSAFNEVTAGEDLVQAADSALYEAKRAGRNCVRLQQSSGRFRAAVAA